MPAFKACAKTIRIAPLFNHRRNHGASRSMQQIDGATRYALAFASGSSMPLAASNDLTLSLKSIEIEAPISRID